MTERAGAAGPNATSARGASAPRDERKAIHRLFASQAQSAGGGLGRCVGARARALAPRQLGPGGRAALLLRHAAGAAPPPWAPPPARGVLMTPRAAGGRPARGAAGTSPAATPPGASPSHHVLCFAHPNLSAAAPRFDNPRRARGARARAPSAARLTIHSRPGQVNGAGAPGRTARLACARFCARGGRLTPPPLRRSHAAAAAAAGPGVPRSPRAPRGLATGPGGREGPVGSFGWEAGRKSGGKWEPCARPRALQCTTIAAPYRIAFRFKRRRLAALADVGTLSCARRRAAAADAAALEARRCGARARGARPRQPARPARARPRAAAAGAAPAPVVRRFVSFDAVASQARPGRRAPRPRPPLFDLDTSRPPPAGAAPCARSPPPRPAALLAAAAAAAALLYQHPTRCKDPPAPRDDAPSPTERTPAPCTPPRDDANSRLGPGPNTPQYTVGRLKTKAGRAPA